MTNQINILWTDTKIHNSIVLSKQYPMLCERNVCEYPLQGFERDFIHRKTCSDVHLFTGFSFEFNLFSLSGTFSCADSCEFLAKMELICSEIWISQSSAWQLLDGKEIERLFYAYWSFLRYFNLDFMIFEVYGQMVAVCFFTDPNSLLWIQIFCVLCFFVQKRNTCNDFRVWKKLSKFDSKILWFFIAVFV